MSDWRDWQRGLSEPLTDPPECRKCRSTEFVDRPIATHDSVGRDCARCGTFNWFARWYGEENLPPLDEDGHFVGSAAPSGVETPSKPKPRLSDYLPAERPEWVTLDVPERVRAKADQYEAAVHEALGKPRDSNHYSLAVRRRYAMGFIGEWAAWEYLRGMNIDVRWTPKADGRADRGDLIIQSERFGPMRIDVKLRQRMTYDKFLYLEEQWKLRRESCDFAIGGVTDAETMQAVQLRCALSRKEIDRLPVSEEFGYPGRVTAFDQCRSIEKFARFLLAQTG